MPVKPILLFAYGNESRGDDGLAPLLLEKIKNMRMSHACGHPLKYLSDFQIQIEHVMDMQGCERVLLMDAHLSQQTSYRLYQVNEQQETLYTTHGMSPSTLLHTYRQVFHEPAPKTFMLSIQAIKCGLGTKLTARAETNLQQVFAYISALMLRSDISDWETSVMS